MTLGNTDWYASRDRWDMKFLRVADEVASWSKDNSTKVGCVVVVPDNDIRSTGYNGFPRGCDDDRLIYDDRHRKLLRITHAEANAVAAAARAGVKLYGCTAYVNYPCCSQCAAILIQAGIIRVVTWNVELKPSWMDSVIEAEQLFREAGVEYEKIERP